jgi:hypothetical protein
MPPLAFQHDPDGTYHDLAAQLRNLDGFSVASDEERPSFEPVEDGEGLEVTRAESKTPATLTRGEKPPRSSIRTSLKSTSRIRMASPEREGERIFKTQKEIISAWIADPDHPANETCRYPLSSNCMPS